MKFIYVPVIYIIHGMLSTLNWRSSNNCSQLMIMTLARPSSVQGIISCSTSICALGAYTTSLLCERIWLRETSEGDPEKR